MSIKRYLNISKVKEVLLFASLFSLPMNLFLSTRPEWSYWQGHFIDYWAPKFYLSQVCIWLLWVITLFFQDFSLNSLKKDSLSQNKRIQSLFLSVATRGKHILEPFFRTIKKSKAFSLVILLFFALIFRQFFTPYPWSALIWITTLLSGPIFLGIYLWKKNRSQKHIFLGLLSGITFQSLLGIYQYLTQSSLAPYRVFGEPSFLYKKDLAISFFSKEMLVLPYGSTPHPNVLAGWMLLGLLLLWFLRKQFNHIWIFSLGSLFFITLLLTESWSAWIALVWGVFVLVIWKVFQHKAWRTKLFLIILFFSFTTFTLAIWLLPSKIIGKTRSLVVDSSLIRRQTFLQVAFREIPHYPWGTGWGQHLTTYSPQDLAMLQHGFIQPIHNVLVIFVIENGFWTLFLLCTFFAFDQKKYSLIILSILLLSPLLSLDHYIYTQIQGQYLFILIAYFLYIKKN